MVKVKSLYEKAMKLGDIDSIYNLAYIAEEDDDPQKAVKLYMLAASKG
jgi:TPR repeat protein